MILYIIIFYVSPLLIGGILLLISVTYSRLTPKSTFGMADLHAFRDMLKEIPGKQIMDYVFMKWETLEHEDKYFWKEIKSIFMLLFLIINFPIILFRLLILAIFGEKVLWKLPISFYDIWNIMIIILSVKATELNSYIIAGIFACCPILSSLGMLGQTITLSNGKIEISKIPFNKLTMRTMIEPIIAIVISFGTMYYIASTYNSNNFNIKLNMLDSMYYSVITVATVGYGDIIPKGNIAKLLTIIEILAGYLYIIYFVSVLISVYVSQRIKDKNK